jgi:hypothetical protein
MCYLYCYKFNKVRQYQKFTGQHKTFMKTYNKSEEVAEKVKCLANNKTTPFGDTPLWIPDSSVSSILCFILLSYKCIS